MLNVKMILIDQRLYEVGVKDDMQRFSTKLMNKCSAVSEMGDRLATIDMGRKLGAVSLLGGGSWVLM